MRYALLICLNEADAAIEDPDRTAAYGEWAREVAERGALQGGERLRPTADATTVRVRGGQVVTTDGPFAETKEQVAGFFLIDAKDLDDAVALAAKLPASEYGSIEVRPIWEM